MSGETSLPGGDDNALVGNAADAGQVRKARKREKLKRDQWLQDLRAVLKTEAGKRVLWHVLEESRVFASSFSGDPHSTSFNEGRRYFGIGLLQDLNELDPRAFFDLAEFNRGKAEKP